MPTLEILYNAFLYSIYTIKLGFRYKLWVCFNNGSGTC